MHLLFHLVKKGSLLLLVLYLVFPLLAEAQVVIQDWQEVTFKSKYDNPVTIAYRLTRTEERVSWMENRYKYRIEMKNLTVYKGYQTPIWLGYNFFINDAVGNHLQVEWPAGTFKDRILSSSQTMYWDKTYSDSFWDADPRRTISVNKMYAWIGPFLTEIESLSEEKQESYFKEKQYKWVGDRKTGSSSEPSTEEQTPPAEAPEPLPTDYKPKRTPKGQAIFYYKIRFCTDDQAKPIEVFVDGRSVGILKSGVGGTPNCGNVDGLTVTLSEGPHYYSASNGHSGTFEVSKDNCTTIPLSGLQAKPMR